MISKFGQLSIALKLVVIWFLMIGLSGLWRFGIDIGTRHVIDLGPLFSGVIGWNLALGLINKITTLDGGRHCLCP